jgi:hypothetical protein
MANAISNKIYDYAIGEWGGYVSSSSSHVAVSEWEREREQNSIKRNVSLLTELIRAGTDHLAYYYRFFIFFEIQSHLNKFCCLKKRRWKL